jgi:hypothetical protein
VVINIVLAGFSIGPATQRKQPASFWIGKCLLLGGLAYGELISRPINDGKRKTRPKR